MAHSAQIVLFTLILVIFGIGSCGPRLKASLPVPEILLALDGVERNTLSDKAFVSIDQVTDGRAEPALAVVNGKEITSEGEIGPSISLGLQKALQRKAVTVTDSAPLVMAVEVRTWLATVRTGLPSSVRSEAALFVQVFDPANKLIYKGLYQGSSTIQHGSVDEKDISEGLATAMAEAIAQVTGDRQLIVLISSF